MTETACPVVLLIGETQSPQFCQAMSVDWAMGFLNSGESHHANSLADAIALVGSGELIPNFVVAYQSIPDEYSADEIDQLIGMLPLSRFVVAFSPWCESIGRTEQRWPSAWSVPLAHAAARIRTELRHLSDDTPPLPATTSRDEAFATLAAGSLDHSGNVGQGMSAKVLSADVPLKECFEQILSSVGFEIENSKQPHELYVVVAAFIDKKQLRQVAGVCKGATRSESSATDSVEPIILVASDMATPDDRTRLLRAGATAVVSELRFAEDLLDCLPAINRHPEGSLSET